MTVAPDQPGDQAAGGGESQVGDDAAEHARKARLAGEPPESGAPLVLGLIPRVDAGQQSLGLDMAAEALEEDGAAPPGLLVAGVEAKVTTGLVESVSEPARS